VSLAQAPSAAAVPSSMSLMNSTGAAASMASVTGINPSSSPLLSQSLASATAMSSASTVSVEALNSGQVIQATVSATPQPGHRRGNSLPRTVWASKLTVALKSPSSQGQVPANCVSKNGMGKRSHPTVLGS
jgi:hypothetical protein